MCLTVTTAALKLRNARAFAWQKSIIEVDFLGRNYIIKPATASEKFKQNMQIKVKQM